MLFSIIYPINTVHGCVRVTLIKVSPAFVGLFYFSANHIKFTYLIKEIIMGKGRDSKKATKKAPTKTAKEKRAEKKLKKADRD